MCAADDVAAIGRSLCNWDRWPADDGVGTLNLITDQKRVEAASCVRDGAVFSLGFELRSDLPQPPGSGRMNPQHLMVGLPPASPGAADGPESADDMLLMSVHAATHWDALSHFFHDGRMYGDVGSAEVTARGGALRNDILPAARRMVTRAVLVDVARHRGVDVLAPGEGIDADELQDALDAQGVEVREGDALLIRTGLLGETRVSGRWSDFAQCGPELPDTPGVAVDALPLIHELGVSAIAADNWAVEQLRGGPERFPLHEVALVYMGLILGENFELDELAAACAADRRYDFLFAGAPLPIRGGVGGPVNPIVIR